MSSGEAKGLLKSLFDFQFTSLITVKIIRFVYALIVVLYSIGALFVFIASLSRGGAGGILTAFILVPLGYLLYLILTRIWMEILIVVFRMGDDVRAIRERGDLGRRPDFPPG